MKHSEQIKEDISRALRANEALKVETLRGLLAAIHNREIELRGKEKELDEVEAQAVLAREAKKRKEAGQIFTEAGRADLAEKELKELEIIKNYLPEGLSPAEVEAIVKKVIDEGATDFGRAMGAVMKEVAGRAEAAEVKAVVEKMLGTNG